MFNCKVCLEKEKRISDLKEQVEYLRGVLHPKPTAVTFDTVQNYQADMLLDGGGKEETQLTNDGSESPEVLAEREAMLSGTY